MIVDRPERIRAFLPQVQELASGGLVTLEEVEVTSSAEVTDPGIRSGSADPEQHSPEVS